MKRNFEILYGYPISNGLLLHCLIMKHLSITPQFPGLKPGDGWCLCALRWKEAYEAGVAPPVKPEATHEKGGTNHI